MSNRRGSDEDIAGLLRRPVWAVVGLTPNPRRPSCGVARFLLDHGIRVMPVNPQAAAVHGRPGVRTLSEVAEHVDVVDIFRRSTEAGAHVDEAIENRCRRRLASAGGHRSCRRRSSLRSRTDCGHGSLPRHRVAAPGSAGRVRAVAEPALNFWLLLGKYLWTTCSPAVDQGFPSVDGGGAGVDGE